MNTVRQYLEQISANFPVFELCLPPTTSIRSARFASSSALAWRSEVALHIVSYIFTQLYSSRIISEYSRNLLRSKVVCTTRIASPPEALHSSRTLRTSSSAMHAAALQFACPIMPCTSGCPPSPRMITVESAGCSDTILWIRFTNGQVASSSTEHTACALSSVSLPTPWERITRGFPCASCTSAAI